MNQELLKELFDYKDGQLYWKKSTNTKIVVGSLAGSLDCKGYKSVQVNGKTWKLHRAIFLMHYGYLPSQIDHINGIKDDNRIENLREATTSNNCLNQKLRKTNTSKIKNVSWHKKHQKWYVQLQVFGKPKHIGCFGSLELAELVAIEARNKYHKEFANHG
ncbi:putative NHN endonuclease [uncultured Caudovirales phage]|uniref:Putative NHN endonuclease n=1 Tax=uncultured Caudovirales phage TaxID=2100421 RepID=A0A6J7WFN8_9CAUD|nr:putative NHN endonuclease [uncultured Caudovirales phage]